MKNKLINIWSKYKYYIILTVIIILFLLFWSIITKIKNDEIRSLRDENKLLYALKDFIHTYKNSYNEIVSEKLTLQFKINDLNKYNELLNADQKELMERIKKNNNIFTAALIRSRIEIDSLKLLIAGKVDTFNNSISFIENKPDLNIDLTISNVRLFDITKPSNLIINKLELPNKQFVEFHWNNNKKEGYPISFSISNSNEYFKTLSIDSYAIPEIKKETLKPNLWQKIGNFFDGKNSIYFGVGIGLTGGYFLFK